MTVAQTRPSLKFYGRVPHSLDYPRVTLYEAVAQTAARVPDAMAWDFLGTESTYRDFLAAIDRCADALASVGSSAGDRILVSMPTSPQGVIAFYAANNLGAVPAMIHPLSTGPEIQQKALVEHCQRQLIKWSCPREVESRPELPKTRVGKIDYKVLVEEHVARSGRKETA